MTIISNDLEVSQHEVVLELFPAGTVAVLRVGLVPASPKVTVSITPFGDSGVLAVSHRLSALLMFFTVLRFQLLCFNRNFIFLCNKMYCTDS